ncbi:hypothetical protein FBR06_05150 [Betaproteobacteria bacterium PRO4]|uniref:hypothetical protein n=1 Tax=Nitrosomonas sp. TaxID=42353 RepID=UPI002569B56B|nr:hypothetical protein [Nitrosomonas sp.]MDL1866633.1 hypothetical protein [Betaproteobacteria bacterium PRO4]
MLEVVEHSTELIQCANGSGAHLLKLAVRHDQNDGVVAAGFWCDAIFVLRFFGKYLNIISIHYAIVVLEFDNDTHDVGIKPA